MANVLERCVRDGACLRFTGSKNAAGYGQVTVVIGGVKGTRMAHRLAMGEPPFEGAQIDHLCHNKDCCNPQHLEWVTLAENVARRDRRSVHYNKAKEACRNGHPYSAENTYVRKDRAGRLCRICRGKASRKHREKEKA